MKKKVTNFIVIMIFIIGISLLLYPVVSDLIVKYKQKKVINSYVATLNTMSNSRYEEMIRDATNYNETLFKSNLDKDVDKLVEQYEELLFVNKTGIISYIEIPKINVQLPIYHGVEENVLQVGVGHLEISSLPVGSENSHTVLFGHRGLPSAKLFSDLDQIKIGDYFKITTLNNHYYYLVDNIVVVVPDEVLDNTKIEANKDYATLVTCTPYGVNTKRLLIRGLRVDESEIDKEGAIKYNNIRIFTKIALIIIINIISLVILTSLGLLGKKERKMKYEL